MKSRIRSTESFISLCYEVPHHIHVSRVYPYLSSSGSTVIVCGHGQGLLILWNSGLPIDHEHERPESTPSNGDSKDAVMIIDSEDEKSEKLNNDISSFQKDEGDRDAFKPSDLPLQTLDLPLGIAVLHISFPRLPSEPHDCTMTSLPKILSENLVIAMACSDFTIRILSLPLLPPSPDSQRRSRMRGQFLWGTNGCGYFGEHMIVLSGGNGHQSVPMGVSLTATRSIRYYDNEMKDARNADHSRNHILGGSFTASNACGEASLEATGNEWDLLVASHSADFSGLLLIHKIALSADGSNFVTKTTEHHTPWLTQYLPSPAISISFNSSLYPAPRHLQLLIAEAKGVVRVFDCLSRHKNRPEGSWLASLYSTFQTSSDLILSRKHIISAEWCLAGESVVVLLADGEWGIWDLENTGPKARNEMKATEGISGSLLTNFTLGGWTGSFHASNHPVKKFGLTSHTPHGLAPMTPGTRRIRQDNLFTGSNTQQTGFRRGGISVFSKPKTPIRKGDDESVLIWHGDNIVILPSLITYWKNAMRGIGNLFGNSRGELRRDCSASLGGEIWKDVSLFPESSPSGIRFSTPDHKDLLITGERKIIVMARPIARFRLQASSNQPAVPSSTDQHLLTIGELDVSGMDRILAGMSNGLQVENRNVSAQEKKVGFSTQS